MMFTTGDTKGHTQMCLTFIFKVNHQSQMTNFGCSEILDLANVRINTKIKSLACIQPEIRKVIQLICVTLSENVIIDTKIESADCITYIYSLS